MSTHFVGIYGLAFTQPIDLREVGGPLIKPLPRDWQEAQKLGRDRNAFHLMGTAEAEGRLDHDYLFDLEAALTFAQQQWITFTRVIDLSPGDSIESVVERLPAQEYDGLSRQGLSPALPYSDSFAPGALAELVQRCMEKLRDPGFDRRTGFRRAFFHNVETHRLVNPLVELIYFLNITALESLARLDQGKDHGPLPLVLTPFLVNLGFDVEKLDPKNLRRSTRVYARLRNALFHQSKLEETIDIGGGQKVTIPLLDYEGPLRALTRDVILRLIGFDHRDIDWSRWLRMG